MTAWLLPAAWGVLLLGWAVAHRPPPPPRRRPATRLGRPRRPPPGGWGRQLLAAAGALVLRAAGQVDPSPGAAARAGSSLAVAVAGALVFGPAGITAGALPPLVAARRAGRRRLRHQAALTAGVAEAADLLVVAVTAGNSIPGAVATVARQARGPLADALARAHGAMEAGRPAVEAISAIGAGHAGAGQLAAVLAAGLRDGAPVAAGLERVAASCRRARRQQAETAARRLPVLLLFPLVLCILPAFALLTVGPVLAGGLHALWP